VARRTVSGVVKKASASGIDLDKLRVALRRLGDEYVFYILDALIDVVPPAELEKVVSGYIDVSQLRPDPRGKQSLLAEVRAFDAASRAGRYYESFNASIPTRLALRGDFHPTRTRKDPPRQDLTTS